MTLTQQIHELTIEPHEPKGEEALRPQKGRLARIASFELTPKKVRTKDLMHFSRQLAVFMRAGIPLVDALDTIREETSNKFFADIIDDINEGLRTGSTFAGAAAQHAGSFPAYYIGILRSAELTGNLDVVLDQLADYIERDIDARRRITSALTYPAIIAMVAVGVVIVLVTYVLPKFVKFFKDLNAKLPLTTRMLINLSDAISTYWYAFVGGGALVVLALFAMVATERGRAVRDRLVLRLPIVGDLVRHSILERFCRILSSMMSAGVALPEAMAVTADATSNAVYRTALTDVREAMLRGEGLAEPLAATGLFPGAARQMFRVGESTGSLDVQLANASSYFDRELDHKLKRFTAIFEPLVIVFMGGIVGFVAIALVSAMYGIFHQVHVS